MVSDICLPKKGIVNVYSDRGTGKSTFFKTKGHVQFDHEILKTKEKTIDFLQRMRCSLLPLVLDDYDLIKSASGLKEFTKGMFTRGTFYVISTEKIEQDWVDQWYQFPGVPVCDFAMSVGVTTEKAQELLIKARGNMTSVRMDLENFGSQRDNFETAKEYLQGLLKDPRPSLNLNKYLTEHGHTFGIIQENYIYKDAPIELLADIANDFSVANLIDVKMYSDVSWDLMPFFNLHACILPASKLPEDLSLDRPASVWTKYSNMCMKMNRFKKLNVALDDISLWILKANSGDPLTRFDSYDIDSLNQLGIGTRINQKITNKLKATKKESRPPRR
jgi:hypothetical protein